MLVFLEKSLVTSRITLALLEDLFGPGFRDFLEYVVVKEVEEKKKEFIKKKKREITKRPKAQGPRLLQRRCCETNDSE